MRPLSLACLLAAAALPAAALPHKDPPVSAVPPFSMPGPGPAPDELGSGSKDEAVDNATLACLILSDLDCAQNANAARMITQDSRHVPMAAPVFGQQQSFERLYSAYPRGSVQDVLEAIGQPAQTWIKNTCAIRVSYAMNFGGFPVDRSKIGPAQKIEFILHGRSAPEPASHAYIFRVNELANYMLKKYGKPQVWAKKTDNPRTAVHGKKGVILFVVSGWSDATGHFDLWDGQSPAGSEYFDKASDVFLWQ